MTVFDASKEEYTQVEIDNRLVLSTNMWLN